MQAVQPGPVPITIHEYDDCEVFSNEYEVPADGLQSPPSSQPAAASLSLHQTNSHLQPVGGGGGPPFALDTLYETPLDASGSYRGEAGACAAAATEYVEPVNSRSPSQTPNGLGCTTTYTFPLNEN